MFALNAEDYGLNSTNIDKIGICSSLPTGSESG
jgi:hypothetical protein